MATQAISSKLAILAEGQQYRMETEQGWLLVEPLVNESLAGYAYLRFERENLLDVICHEKPLSLRGWLDSCAKTPTLAAFRCPPCLMPDIGQSEMVGVGWAGSLFELDRYRRAEVGMGFFRGYAQFDLLLNLGKLMLTWAFRELDLDMAYGITPVPNRAASLYFLKLGLNAYGPIARWTTYQGQACDAWLSAVTREDWLARVEVISGKKG